MEHLEIKIELERLITARELCLINIQLFKEVGDLTNVSAFKQNLHDIGLKIHELGEKAKSLSK